MDEFALVVGEALVDVVEAADGTVTERPGGSAANAAVALGRLGRPVSLATSYGDDARGALLRDHLAGSRVLLATDPYVVPRTSAARARIGPDGAATYDFDVDWRLGPVTADDARVLLVCSLGPLLDPGADDVRALVERLRPGASVAYDLNVRPAITGTGPDVVARVERTAALADLVKASDEDLLALWPGAAGDRRHLADVAGHLLDLGATAVVVTRGPDGAEWHTRTGSGTLAGRPAPVVDTIGAGDTFGAALLDALWDHLGGRLAPLPGEVWHDALRHAAACAAVTVSRAGADPPWRSEL